MAIDSRQKRASIASLGLAFLGASIVPGGSFAVGDRQTIANSYYGIDSTVTGIDVGGELQIDNFTAEGVVTLEINTGGESQLEVFDAEGGVSLEINVGGTSQLLEFTSTGGIQVGDAVVEEGGQRGRVYDKKRRKLSLKKKHEDERKEQKRIEKIFLGETEVNLEDYAIKTLDDIPEGIDIPLEKPIAENAIALKDIKDDLDRELVRVYREKAVRDYNAELKKRLEQVRMLDEELYFMVLALLDDDF